MVLMMMETEILMQTMLRVHTLMSEEVEEDLLQSFTVILMKIDNFLQHILVNYKISDNVSNYVLREIVVVYKSELETTAKR
jgi:GGDEF domain-containing protein